MKPVLTYRLFYLSMISKKFQKSFNFENKVYFYIIKSQKNFPKMRFTLVSKNYGMQNIDTENFNPAIASTDSTIFKVVEHIFNEWFDYNTQPGAPMAKDIVGMYEGECDQPAIYSKKGAIRQGIENIIEHMIETGKQYCKINTRDVQKIDVEAAFN